jgi:hypothetical protein
MTIFVSHGKQNRDNFEFNIVLSKDFRCITQSTAKFAASLSSLNLFTARQQNGVAVKFLSLQFQNLFSGHNI